MTVPPGGAGEAGEGLEETIWQHVCYHQVLSLTRVVGSWMFVHH